MGTKKTTPLADPPPRLSLRAYSDWRRSRGLRGHSLIAIQKAIKDGRIARICATHPRCPPACSRGKIDPAQADADWERFTTPGADRGGSDAAPELLAAKVLRETWAGRNERLKFEERAGALVRVDAIQRQLFARGRRLRDGLTEIRLRLAPELAAEDEVRRVDRILREAFDQLLQSVALPEAEGSPKSRKAPRRERSPKRKAAPA